MAKFKKNFEWISSHHWSNMSNVTYKVKMNRIKIVQALLLLFMPKTVKEALRARLSGNKITRTETFVRSKKIVKWKTTLNWETLAYYENLPTKTHLKKNNSSNNSENTNHRHLLLIGNNHSIYRLSENVHF